MAPLLARLFGLLCAGRSAPGAFGACLLELVGPARRGDLRRGFAGPQALELMLDAMTLATPARAAGGEDVPAPSVRDALEALVLLEHFLRPLAHPVRRADLCHCVSGGLGALPALVAKAEHGTPFLLGEHGLYLRERLLASPPGSLPHHVRALVLRFFSRLTEAAYEGADLIVPVCNYNRLWEQASGAQGLKIRPVYNGVEPEAFPPPPPEPERPSLVWLGRIDEIKDVETLLRAFALVRTVVPEATLDIYGPDGEPAYAAWCRDLAHELGIADTARFGGQVPPEALAATYQQGQVVLLTSISEGFPFAVLEAMASGRPVVATDVGGIREALGEAGVLVAPRSPGELARACLTLLSEPGRRRTIGDAGRRRVLALFTAERSLDKYRALYGRLAEPPSAERTRLVLLPRTVAVPEPSDLVLVGEEVS
jgi:glycosyltransferase involved in cell wall biosynthesis